MFEEINIETISIKVFDIIGNQWMLISAGNLENHNSMTASWGGFGVLWNAPMATIYVRPQRYTKKFIDSCDFFTLSFFEEKYKEKLKIYGTISGKNENKDNLSGLTPKSFNKSVAFEEASLILLCKKIYISDIKPEEILEKENIDIFYKNRDFHQIYMGKIVKTYRNINSTI